MAKCVPSPRDWMREQVDKVVVAPKAPELWRNLGDDVWLKAAYRGGCQACQNLPKGAIRHAERYHCHSLPSA